MSPAAGGASGRPARPDAMGLLRVPARWAALAAGWSLLGLSALIGLEVVLRKVFNASLQGADEMGGYVVACVVGFGGALATLDRAHTRIDLLLERLPAGLRALLNVAAALSLAAMAGFLALRGWATMQESVEYRSLSGTPLQTPLWAPQAVWVAGLAFFAAVALTAALHAVALLALDRGALNRRYGARSLNEEIAEERASLADRGGDAGA